METAVKILADMKVPKEKVSAEKVRDNCKKVWWEEEYGFFGSFYMEGDRSQEGYLESKEQSLEERSVMEAEGVISLLGLSPGMALLDCPCGYGRHSNLLVSKGIKVTGADINSVHLDYAIRHAEKNALNTKFIKKNMLAIDINNEFDAVINMFYSFGFFDTDEENFQVLLNFYNALKPGGKFLMHTDVNIPRITTGRYKFDEIRTLTSGNQLHIIDAYSPETKRIDGVWRIIRPDGEVQVSDYSVRVYTKDEFTELCRKAGFREVRVFSDWNGQEYCEDSEDMIIIAEK